MPILQIRDKDGKFIPIPSVKGKDGKNAYEQAKEGGYTGSEEQFIALLNGLTNSGDADHYSDFNNPHRVTKEHIGLGNVDNTSDVNKPVSDAQATAIADAKKAGTDAQNALSSHTTDNSNPHNVTAEQIGGARIIIDTYTGAGYSGASYPNTITFPFVPKLVFIRKQTDETSNGGYAWINGNNTGLIFSGNSAYLTAHLAWNDRTLTWWIDAENVPAKQLNAPVVYNYVAIG